MNLNASSDNLYNNADSFAMAFDTAWKESILEKDKDNENSIEERVEITLKKLKNHPFLIENPIRSKEIAFFRIKLLGLS